MLGAIAVVLPVLLGVFGAQLVPPALVWLLVLVVAAQVAYALRAERNSRARQNG